MPRTASLLFAGVVCSAVAMILVAVGRNNLRDDSGIAPDVVAQLAESGGSATWQESPPAQGATPIVLTTSAAQSFPVIILQPSGPPRIELAGMDPQGRSGSVACSTCHAVRKPNPENVSAATLDEFHQGMTFKHGQIACHACHNPDDSDALRLADGTSVAYENVITLCSQCHSQQAESFTHGAHGGMNGHWDLSRGPQIKNNCIDCHDPHAPAYPKMVVGFKPRDRFNAPHGGGHHEQKGVETRDNH